MKAYPILLFIVFGFNSNLINAQDIHGGGEYNGNNGSTTWGFGGGRFMVYVPDENGSSVTWCNCEDMTQPCDCEQAQCQGVESERCKELLEYANGGQNPSAPDGETPGKGGKPGKGKNPGKGKKPKSEMQALISGIPDLSAGKVYFRTPEGKWVEMKNKKAWTQKIIQSL
jgi:hypothetical protein